MRISDWSSDVCSSDLQFRGPRRLHSRRRHRQAGRTGHPPPPARLARHGAAPRSRRHFRLACALLSAQPDRGARSEEHTSELQSRMRISYDVFCLKKKKKITRNTNNVPHTTQYPHNTTKTQSIRKK